MEQQNGDGDKYDRERKRRKLLRRGGGRNKD
jgi:hypothetical protein